MKVSEIKARATTENKWQTLGIKVTESCWFAVANLWVSNAVLSGVQLCFNVQGKFVA